MTDAAEGPSLAHLLRLSVLRLNRRLRAQQPGGDVSLSQLSALSTLHRLGPMSPGQLAAREGVRPPSMTRVVAALQERGLVRRTQHPTDGRQSVVEVSAAGTDLVQANISAREAWLDKQIGALSAEDAEVLRRATRVLDAISGCDE